MQKNGMKRFPNSYKDLLLDKARAMGYLATLMPDGTPQLTPLWFNSDGKHIFINTARGRTKDRNMRARPQVAIVIQDPKDVNRYIQVRGHVVKADEENALEHMDRLTMKYRRHHWKPVRGQVRVVFEIEPDSISVDS